MSEVRRTSARLSALVVLAGAIGAGLVVDAADDDSPVGRGGRRGGGRGDARCPTRSHAVVHLVLRRRHRHRGRLRRPCPAHREPERPERDRHDHRVAGDDRPRPGPRRRRCVHHDHRRRPRPPPCRAGHSRSRRSSPRPRRAASTFFLRDIVEAPLAGAVVEVEGGEVAVEHEIRGDLGRATAPCATTASPTWSFPWGVTARGARELLVFMNPFPDDATVDITFATDEGVRDTLRFRASSCPGAASSAPTSTRTSPGRSRCRRRSRCAAAGWCSTASRPSPASTAVRASRSAWARPSSARDVDVPGRARSGEGLAEQIVVYNPGDRVAEVEVEVRLDDPETNGTPEPFELTVAPSASPS